MAVNPHFGRAMRDALDRSRFHNPTELSVVSGVPKSVCYRALDGVIPRCRNLARILAALGERWEKWVPIITRDNAHPDIELAEPVGQYAVGDADERAVAELEKKLATALAEARQLRQRLQGRE